MADLNTCKGEKNLIAISKNFIMEIIKLDQCAVQPKLQSKVELNACAEKGCYYLDRRRRKFSQL